MDHHYHIFIVERATAIGLKSTFQISNRPFVKRRSLILAIPLIFYFKNFKLHKELQEVKWLEVKCSSLDITVWFT